MLLPLIIAKMEIEANPLGFTGIKTKNALNIKGYNEQTKTNSILQLAAYSMVNPKPITSKSVKTTTPYIKPHYTIETDADRYVLLDKIVQYINTKEKVKKTSRIKDKILSFISKHSDCISNKTIEGIINCKDRNQKKLLVENLIESIVVIISCMKTNTEFDKFFGFSNNATRKEIFSKKDASSTLATILQNLSEMGKNKNELMDPANKNLLFAMQAFKNGHRAQYQEEEYNDLLKKNPELNERLLSAERWFPEEAKDIKITASKKLDFNVNGESIQYITKQLRKIDQEIKNKIETNTKEIVNFQKEVSLWREKIAFYKGSFSAIEQKAIAIKQRLENTEIVDKINKELIEFVKDQNAKNTQNPSLHGFIKSLPSLLQNLKKFNAGEAQITKLDSKFFRTEYAQLDFVSRLRMAIFIQDKLAKKIFSEKDIKTWMASAYQDQLKLWKEVKYFLKKAAPYAAGIVSKKAANKFFNKSRTQSHIIGFFAALFTKLTLELDAEKATKIVTITAITAAITTTVLSFTISLPAVLLSIVIPTIVICISTVVYIFSKLYFQYVLLFSKNIHIKSEPALA